MSENNTPEFEVNGRDYGLVALRVCLGLMVVAFVALCALVVVNG